MRRSLIAIAVGLVSRCVAACFVLFFVGACSDGGGSGHDNPVTPTVATIDIEAPATHLAPGSSVQLSAIVRDEQGVVLGDRTIAWSSSDPTLLSISQTGLVSANATGSVTVSATADGRSDSITLSSAEIFSIQIAAPTYAIEPGDSVQLRLLAKDKAEADLWTTVSWTSSQSDVAEVTDTGLVNGLTLGFASITASVGQVQKLIGISVQHPERNKIAFASARGPLVGIFNPQPQGGIYLMNTDGSSQQLLIESAIGVCTTIHPGDYPCAQRWKKPSWNPDGMRLATSSFRLYAPEWGGSMIFLCAIGPPCTQLELFPRRINWLGVDSPVLGRSPAWSPDGRRLAFSGTTIWDAANYSYSAWSVAFEDEPAWSPDGTQLAVVRNTFDSSTGDDNFDIWIRNVDGDSAPVRLTDAAGDDTSPQWSVSGKIAFVSSRDGNREIYVMNADGTSVLNLTNNPADDASPSWSPDGASIAFQTDRDGNSEIYSMYVDGSHVTNLTNHPAEDTEPAWSP